MDKKILCVMAGFDRHTDAYLSRMKQHLDENGYVGRQTKNIPHHITLATFDVEREEEIALLVNHVAKTTCSLEVNCTHIGVFGGANVLFIAPDLNRTLLDLKEKFGVNQQWTPHITMLIDQPDLIYQAMPILAQEFEPYCANVTTLYLYEFCPARCIRKESFLSSDLQLQ